MVMLFQIRVHYIEIPGASPVPTVFLDIEESSVAILTDMRNGDEDPRYRLTREMHLTNSTLANSIFAVHASYAQSLSFIHSSQNQKREFLPIINLPWSFSDDASPSHHIYRAYPLKVTLHQNLRALHLADDGSRLFRKASFETLFCTPAFSETQPRVEFKVEVALATGKIMLATCVRELTDKRLQGVAQRLVKCLRFSPSQETIEKTTSGILTLQFAGTFDMISTLLDTEQKL
jgi:hypothetical protein